LTTGNVFKETYSLVKDFSEHNFANRSQKIENVKKIKLLEAEINKNHEKFNEVVTRIKRQDLAIIDSARNSFRPSVAKKEGSFDTRKDSQQMNIIFMNGKDYLYSEVDEREKTVNMINKYEFLN
jgi:hypothetical protein